MKVEISFDEALKAFVQERRLSSWEKSSVKEVSAWVSDLLDTLPSWDAGAQAMICVIEASPTIRSIVLGHFAADEED